MHQFKTTNIKGKAYVEVSQRILYFRTAPEYKGWTMESDLVSYDDQSCIVRATIRNAEGIVVAVGHAQEDRTSSMINKTSYVENCESSAWGRCLGNLGIGIETSIATADEVAMAIAKQNLPAKQSQETQSQETQPASLQPDEVFQKAMDYIKANPTEDKLKMVLAKRGELYEEGRVSSLFTEAQVKSLQSLIKKSK